MSRRRSSRLDDWLESRRCRALLVRADSSTDPWLAPFVGPGRLGPCFVVAPRGSDVRLGFLSPMERDEAARSGLSLLTPADLDVQRWARGGASVEAVWAGAIDAGLRRVGLSPTRIALAGLGPAGQMLEIGRRLQDEGWTFVPGEGAVRLVRRTKTADELAEIRRVVTAVEAAFRAVARILTEARIRDDGSLALGRGIEGGRENRERPLCVADLRREIGALFAGHGLEQPERNIVAPGGEGAVPHTTGSDERVLRASESLIVDLFPRDRLFADCTRTFCVGEPPVELERAHRDVVEALELAEREAAPGVEGWAIQQGVCAHFESRGWSTPISEPGTDRGYVHGLGHGVGFSLHEEPTFREKQGEEGVLAPGDVITLEPGLYDPEAGWGVRVEDLYCVTESGVENLVDLPRALDPSAWD